MNEPVEETFIIESSAGQELHGVVHLPQRGGPCPTVVICHGFKGFMEWGFFPPLANLLAERGMTAIRFNFSGAGMKPGDNLVTDTEAFRLATLSRDRDDLLDVLAALERGELAAGRADISRLGIIGHSRGGNTAVLTAAHANWRQRLRALVTWASVGSYPDLYPEALKDEWRQNGHLNVKNARTGQELPVDASVLIEMETHKSELTALGQAPHVEAPWLIVHGTDDPGVPVEQARQLNEAATHEQEHMRLLLEIQDGGHTFGAVHPFQGPTPHLIEAMNATQLWLKRWL